MDSVVPVDVYVPGCAARPEAIIDGVVKGLAVMEEKHKRLAAPKGADMKPEQTLEVIALSPRCWKARRAMRAQNARLVQICATALPEPV